MKTYTYSEARQRLAHLLDLARQHGGVRIRRRDGQLFDVVPAREVRSPLDVPGVRTDVTAAEVASWRRQAAMSSAGRSLDVALSAPPARARRPRRKKGP